MDGWICSYRQMLDNPVVCKDAEYFAVWNFLLLSATHQDYEIFLDGHRVTLKPGQLVTSRRSIADKFSISDSKVQRILKAFENEHQIEQLTNHQNRVISIVNWDEYQKYDPQSDPRVNHDRTTTEPRVNTNNNINNITTEQQNNITQQNNSLNVSASETVPPVEKPDFPSQTVTAKKPTLYEQGVEVLEKQMSRTMLSPVVKDELRKYLLYRKKIKKVVYADITICNLVAKVEEVAMKYGDTLVLEQFEKTFTNGWQGVFLAEKDLKRTVNENRAGKTYSGGQPTYDWSKL